MRQLKTRDEKFLQCYIDTIYDFSYSATRLSFPGFPVFSPCSVLLKITNQNKQKTKNWQNHCSRWQARKFVAKLINAGSSLSIHINWLWILRISVRFIRKSAHVVKLHFCLTVKGLIIHLPHLILHKITRSQSLNSNVELMLFLKKI